MIMTSLRPALPDEMSCGQNRDEMAHITDKIGRRQILTSTVNRQKRPVYGCILCLLAALLLSGCGNNGNTGDVSGQEIAVELISGTGNEAAEGIEPADDITEPADDSSGPADEEGREGFSVSEITDELFDRMKAGNTYKEDCIVPREDLRYLSVLHIDKDGNTHHGEMVVNRLIADDVLEIFEKLYDAGYPIERMVLADDYMADDEMMMRDNNSSCFNFRFISHTDKVSKHGLGMAVDINTLYNPFHKTVTNDDGSTEEITEPATAKAYLDRTKDFDYKIEKGDLCYTLFTEKGFEWGGDWKNTKDYQHFELPDEITDKYSGKLLEDAKEP